DRPGQARLVVVLASDTNEPEAQSGRRLLHAADTGLADQRTLHADREGGEAVTSRSRSGVDVRQRGAAVAGDCGPGGQSLLELVVDQELGRNLEGRRTRRIAEILAARDQHQLGIHYPADLRLCALEEMVEDEHPWAGHILLAAMDSGRGNGEGAGTVTRVGGAPVGPTRPG